MIGSSRIRRAGLAGFALAEVAAVILLADKGYPALAMMSTPGLIHLLWLAASGGNRGAVLYWRAGRWHVASSQHAGALSLVAHNCRMPWVVYLAFRGDSDTRRATFWLFADAVDREPMRRLRVLLALLPQTSGPRKFFGVSTVSRASGRVSG
ncbi:MAG: protein YgfX [Halioglobus sp.]|nr:protein YgfX [Halioglobus sp.]